MLTAAALPAAFAHPAPLAFLEGIGAMEMILVAIIGLLLFGGKGLPDMARTVGKVVREFKKATSSVEHEVKRVMDEEPEPARRPRPKPRPLAALPASPVTPAQSVPATDLHSGETPPPPPASETAPDHPRT